MRNILLYIFLVFSFPLFGQFKVAGTEQKNLRVTSSTLAPTTDLVTGARWHKLNTDSVFVYNEITAQWEFDAIRENYFVDNAAAIPDDPITGARYLQKDNSEEWIVRDAVAAEFANSFAAGAGFYQQKGTKFIELQPGKDGYNLRSMGLVADYSTGTSTGTDIGPQLETILNNLPTIGDIDLYLPAGNYYLAGNRVITAQFTGSLTLRGDPGTVIYVGGANLLQFDDRHDNLEFIDLEFRTADGISFNGSVFRTQGCDNVIMHRVKVFGLGAVNMQVSNVWGDYSENWSFTQCYFDGKAPTLNTKTTANLITLQYARNVSFSQTQFISTNNDGIKSNVFNSGIVIDQCYFEDCDDDNFDSYGGTVGEVVITNSKFNGGQVELKSTAEALSQHNVVENCWFYNGALVSTDGNVYAEILRNDGYAINGDGVQTVFTVNHNYGLPSGHFAGKVLDQTGAEVAGVTLAANDNNNLDVTFATAPANGVTYYYYIQPFEGGSVNSENLVFGNLAAGGTVIELVETDWHRPYYDLETWDATNGQQQTLSYTYTYSTFFDTLTITFDAPVPNDIVIAARISTANTAVKLYNNIFEESQGWIGNGGVRYDIQGNLFRRSTPFPAGQFFLTLPMPVGVSSVRYNTFEYPPGLDHSAQQFAINEGTHNPVEGITPAGSQTIIEGNYFKNIDRAVSFNLGQFGRGRSAVFKNNIVYNPATGSLTSHGFRFKDKTSAIVTNSGLIKYQVDEGNKMIQPENITATRSGRIQHVPHVILEEQSEKAVAYTARSGELIPVNTTGGPVTINFPDDVFEGARFAVFDSRGQAETNAITIGDGTDRINGESNQTYILNKKRGKVEFYYSQGGGTIGWIQTESVYEAPVSDELALQATTRTSDFTASCGRVYKVDASGGQIIVTPPNNIAGCAFEIYDETGDAGTNSIHIDFQRDGAGNVTKTKVDPGGGAQLLHTYYQDYTINADGGRMRFDFFDATIGWIKAYN